MKVSSIEALQNDNKNTKAKVSERAGDWNCLKCKNLNFSFRNKCNRCEYSKEENEKQKPLLITTSSSFRNSYQYPVYSQPQNNGFVANKEFLNESRKIYNKAQGYSTASNGFHINNDIIKNKK